MTIFETVVIIALVIYAIVMLYAVIHSPPFLEKTIKKKLSNITCPICGSKDILENEKIIHCNECGYVLKKKEDV